MSVRVRLTRVGSKKNAVWRVVVADRRSPRDGRFIEMIGHYNPQTEPSTIVIDDGRLQHWLQRGAQPTNTVRKLMRANTAGPPAEASATDAPAMEAPTTEAPAADASAPEAPTTSAEPASPPQDGESESG